MLINHYHNQVHNVIGSATNTDIGFSYKQYNLLFTGTIKNIYQNKKMEYSNKAIEELPLSTTLSAHLYYAYIQPMAQISISNHGLQGYSIGSIISHPSFSYLDVLVGFKSAYHLAGFRHRMTLGFGLNMNNMSVNFTYEKSNSVAFDHNTYFSMNYNF